MSLDDLAEQIKLCTRCELRASASAPVPGFGDIGAKYILIGEAPGGNEDKEGIPFVGLAGRRLNQLLELGGIDINDCYLTNVCKCRPPGNKTPRKAFITACKPWLMQEIAMVCPETIITLGATPLGLFSSNGVGQMHGTIMEVVIPDAIKVNLIAQYHPAAALHQPRLWSVMLNDWQSLPESVPHDYMIVTWVRVKEWLNE